MSRRRRASDASNQFQLLFSFDAVEHTATVVERVEETIAEPSGGAYVIQPEHARYVNPIDVAPTILQNNRGQAQVLVDHAAPVVVGDKPAYRIPLMAEINIAPKIGLRIVSTFSGCGGSCLGFKMAGYDVLWANEFVPAAQETYRANHKTTYLDTSDIRAVTPESIRAVIGDGEIDVLEGSPPCASFSTAGKTSRGWGQVRKYSDVKQRTDDLFGQYIRLLDGLRPRAFVAENVAGMVKGVSKGFFFDYFEMFKKLPYNVEARLLDAQYLGVPQRRVRLIFVGVRKDVGKPAWPTMLPYRYSVRDAIPWITRQGDNGGFGVGAMQDASNVSPTIGAGVSSGNGRFSPAVVEAMTCRTVNILSRKMASGDCVDENTAQTMDDYAIGKEWDNLAPSESSNKFFNLVRTDAEAPCNTVTAEGAKVGFASIAHPFERRKFAISELRRICGFPDDFVLTGTYAQQWERLGRSVPPPMMRAVAAALVPVLSRRNVSDDKE